MNTNYTYTLVNPQTGNLAFKLFSFDDNSHFDHIQRLGYFSLILINEGKGKLKADFAEFDFGGNTLMSFAPYQPFMIQNEKPIRGVCISFHPEFFCIYKHTHDVACNGVLFNNIYESPCIDINATQSDYISSIIEQMKAEMPQVSFAQCDMIVSFLRIFLIYTSRIKVEQSPQAELNLTNNEQPFILQNLKDAIETNFKEKHSVSDYAELLNIPAQTLAKACKKHFNKTISNLISERIIIEAKRELYLTSKPIKQIAYELGYQDEYYFSRFFKINAEIAPQMYRETVGFGMGDAG